jgi:hypothetical protein
LAKIGLLETEADIYEVPEELLFQPHREKKK